jgi:hypothetical protein
MKAHYKTRNGRMTFEVEGDIKGIFRAVSELQEVFEPDEQCEACQGKDFHYRCRTVEDNDYYEIVCAHCTATLSLGQTKKGSLFPKRKDGDGNRLQNRGWKVWEGKQAATPIRKGQAG